VTLRGVRETYHGTLVAVLPRMTALRLLVLENHGEEQLRAAGGLCSCRNPRVFTLPLLRAT
jgi:hypothetical protein